METGHPATPNLYGIWQFDGFAAEWYRREPLLTAELRWHRMIFDCPLLMSDPLMVIAQYMDDSFEETPAKTRPSYWWPELENMDRIVIDGEDWSGHEIDASFTYLRRTRHSIRTTLTGMLL
jgi:hypothetical protein